MTFQQVVYALKARYKISLGILLVALILGVALSIFLPKQYTATTALLVDSKVSDPLLGGVVPSNMVPGYLATQVDVISSDRVAQRVVAITRLDQVPVIEAQWRDATDGQGDIRVWLGALLKRSLEVKPSRESSVINLSFSGVDPQFAAAIANAYAQAYIETTLELKVEPAKQYAFWFNERTKGLRDELEQAQKRLSEYQQTHELITGDGRFDLESARLAELSSQLIAVQGQRADSKSRQSQSGSADSLPEVMNNPLVSSLKADVARLEAQRQQTLGRLGANHPEISRMDTELSTLKERIEIETQSVVNSLGTNSRISRARVEEIELAVEQQKKKVLELKAHHDQVSVLQRDVENAQRSYDLVTQRLTQTSLESQAQQTNVVVLTPATPPLNHSSPRLLLNLAVSVFLGGLFGIGVALLLEFSDQRIRSSDDLSGFDDVPLLGAIPGNDLRGRWWGRHLKSA